MGFDTVYNPCDIRFCDGTDSSEKTKGWKFVRVAYVIPNIIPTVATAVMFSLLLNPSFGIVKMIYEKLGLNTSQVVNLFGNSKYAFLTVTATWVFYSGFNMLIFLGEMGAISPDIYEAAMIDGATAGQADRYITIPLMKNAFGTCVILASVAMVSQFDIIYMTTKGGWEMRHSICRCICTRLLRWKIIMERQMR